MSEAPFVNFYTSDFLAGTSGMTAATKGVYITLLCLMYEAEMPLAQSRDVIARRCGCTVPALEKAIAALIDDGKVEVGAGGIWSQKCEKHIASRRERRKSAKAAAEKRWQKNEQKQGKTDAAALSAQCKPEPEPEVREEAKASLSPAGYPKPFDEIALAVSAYNEAAEAAGWPKVQVLSSSRRSALRARLKEAGGVTGWEQALARARASPHLCGQNDRGWRANFDFLTRQSSFAKLMEGNYDPAPRNLLGKSNPNANPASRAIHDALRMGAAQRFGDGSG
jgi:uncharacterized protein YdaU (DUF1376 family)